MRYPHLPLAKKVARELGLVPTWPNLQVIRLAIDSEAAFSGAPAAEVALMLIRAANEFTIHRREQYSYALQSRIAKTNSVDRFWFEDHRWRDKQAHSDFWMRFHPTKKADKAEKAEISTPPSCIVWCRCNGRGYIFNNKPGPRTIPCPECAEQIPC